MSFPKYSCHAKSIPKFPFVNLCLSYIRKECSSSDNFLESIQSSAKASEFNCTIYRNYYHASRVCIIYILTMFIKHQYCIWLLTMHEKLVSALKNLFQNNSSWLNQCQALNFELTAVERR